MEITWTVLIRNKGRAEKATFKLTNDDLSTEERSFPPGYWPSLLTLRAETLAITLQARRGLLHKDEKKNWERARNQIKKVEEVQEAIHRAARGNSEA